MHDSVNNPDHGYAELSKRLGERFKALALIDSSGNPTIIFGQIPEPTQLSPAEMEHLVSSKTLIFTQRLPSGALRIFMQRALDPQLPTRGTLLAEVNSTYVWGTPEENPLPPMTELCILDQQQKVVFSTLPAPVVFPEQVSSQLTSSKSGQFEWQVGDKAYIASYRIMFLKFSYLAPEWILVLSESKAHVLAPMANFKNIFPLVVLMALWVVLLLSISQIRRSLIPLEKLQEGTRRIAERDFAAQVKVTSGDEFQELAESFNAMAGRLGRQFNALTTMNEIDRSILSALDTRKIVDTILTRMRELFPCGCVGVALLDSESSDAGLMHIQYGESESENWLVPITLRPEEVQTLYEHPEQLLIDSTTEYPQYLASLAGLEAELFLALPMFVNERLSGLIVLGYFDPEELNEEDAVQARQLADQVAVAMSNAKVMGLNQKEVDDLHRGGLLHDIGKIGITPEILDKAGKLTDEEYKFMQEHVRIGARILEPIEAYAGVIPVVLHHHEYFDGSGYPEGFSGEDIDLGARIFTVADHFDALISDRPYREGLARETVIGFITEGSGSKFDPRVVDAFLEVMAQEEMESKGESEAAV
jgi:HAMP domain-containing protein